MTSVRTMTAGEFAWERYRKWVALKPVEGVSG
jgi:hypothetical protein